MYSSKNFTNPSWQKKETEIIVDLLKHNDVFINLGANIGYYVCLASNFKVKTFAFEPDFFNLKVLFKNIQLNKVKNCLVLPLATYSQNSIKPIYGRGVTASLYLNWDNTEVFDNKDFIQTVKLDDLIKDEDLEKNTFILMDIENSEYQTLLGSTKILQSKKKPSWIVEVHPRFYSKSDHKLVEFDKIFQLFWENDYASYLIAKETIFKIDQVTMPTFIN
jgi:FkbM family methyltransferase